MTRLPAKAVLFDLDGTLVDSFDAIEESYLATLAEMGRPPIARRDLKRLVGPALIESWRTLVPPEAAEEGVRRYREHYARVFMARSRPYPGAREALAEMARGGRGLAVVTNKKGSFARDLVEGLGLGEHVRLTVGDGDGPPPKPAPDMLFHALERLGVAPEDAIYVGDSPGDVDVALLAGMVAVGVTTGFYSEAELAARGPRAVVKDLADLAARLA